MTTTTVQPDPQLRTKDASARAGMTPAAWRKSVSAGYAPKADGRYDERSPWWFASTVDRFNATRLGRGNRTDLKSAATRPG